MATATQESDNGTQESSLDLAVVPGDDIIEVVREERMFELAQRKAQIYAKSSLVPKEYQNNVGNVLIAQNMAKRMGADTLMVMQNLYVVHGRPAWSSQFLIASFNSCGRFSAIRYKCFGTAGQPESGCQAHCTELSTGDIIEGPRISWEMAKAEGWVNKSGSKWKTMPEQMFRYRAAAFLIRTTAPEIGMGLLTADEVEDMVVDAVSTPRATSLDALADKITQTDEHDETQDDPPEEPVDEHPFSFSPLGGEPQGLQDFLFESSQATSDRELGEIYESAEKVLKPNELIQVAAANRTRAEALA
jgi:hypothetical protein